MQNPRAWKALLRRILGKSTLRPVHGPAYRVVDTTQGPMLPVAEDVSEWTSPHPEQQECTPSPRLAGAEHATSSERAWSVWATFSSSTEVYGDY